MGSAGGLAVAVWTTTPWTLPANLAVAVSETIDYSVVEHASLGNRCVGRELERESFFFINRGSP